MAGVLQLRPVAGGHEEFTARIDDVELPAGEHLTARTVWLEDGTGEHELRQHRPVGGDGRREGYLRLDNEIFVGRRLYQAAGSGRAYPPELACLYGDEATSADPYTLFEPYRGRPLSEAAEGVFADETASFASGLLTGLCWLAGAGIAHRAISPDTVWWDGYRVQITDFSYSMPFGMARTPMTGVRNWVAPESRPDNCSGAVGSSDDVWAAARLIFYFRTGGQDLEDRADLDKHNLAQLFSGLLQHVIGPPENRPTASDLIEYGLRRPDLIPSLKDPGMQLRGRRASFLNAREAKYPGAEIPDGFMADVTWRHSLWEAGAGGTG
ncbi:MAG TPA: serine/threonine-protein kinase [Trebonia sp.]